MKLKSQDVQVLYARVQLAEHKITVLITQHILQRLRKNQNRILKTTQETDYRSDVCNTKFLE